MPIGYYRTLSKHHRCRLLFQSSVFGIGRRSKGTARWCPLRLRLSPAFLAPLELGSLGKLEMGLS